MSLLYEGLALRADRGSLTGARTASQVRSILAKLGFLILSVNSAPPGPILSAVWIPKNQPHYNLISVG